MPDEVYQLISACLQGKAAADFVFTREDGKPVRTFRKTWANVCMRAEVPELLLHDLRRSGARNLRRLGVGETVAMQIGGSKTRSVFQRYDIVSQRDIAEAARLLDAKREERAKAAEIRHSSDTVSALPTLEGTKSAGPVVN